MKPVGLVTQSEMETLLGRLLEFLNGKSTNKIKQDDFRVVTKQESFYSFDKYDKILRCLSSEGLIQVERKPGDIEPISITLNDAAYNYIQKKKNEKYIARIGKIWDILKMIISAILGGIIAHYSAFLGGIIAHLIT